MGGGGGVGGVGGGGGIEMYIPKPWEKGENCSGVERVLDGIEITFIPPPVPLLGEPQDVDTAWFCNRSTLVDPDYCLNQDLCMCTHLINVPLGKVTSCKRK